jgi:DNA-binding SARP family transcriptional activator
MADRTPNPSTPSDTDASSVSEATEVAGRTRSTRRRRDDGSHPNDVTQPPDRRPGVTGLRRAATVAAVVGDPVARTARERGETPVKIKLLGEFEVARSGTPVHLQPSAQRLLAFAAIQDRPVTRSRLATVLWPDTEEARAGANLRSSLWRLGGREGRLVSTFGDAVQLEPSVDVDVKAMQGLTHQLLGEGQTPTDPQACISLLEDELLPGWWDGWVVAERERFRVLQLHALECLAARLLHAGEYAYALESCLTLIRAEPFRESARRLLIATHVAEGNLAEAVAHYGAFRDLLWRELGLYPSPLMDGLMQRVSSGRVPPPDPPRPESS